MREINNVQDVLAAGKWSGVDSVLLRTHRLKYRGLLLHALKYGFWALKPGGELVIEDSGPAEDFIAPYTIPFSLVRMLAFQAIGVGSETLELDPARYVIRLRRVAEPAGRSWQAGVVISGDSDEAETLTQCLAGLAAQPELQRPGAILVCGPESARTLLHGMPGEPFLQLVPYESSARKPFPICDKKHHLITTMTADRLAVLHARIRLDPDVLRHAPAEFDIAAPQVWTEGSGRRREHISYTVQDASLPFRYGRISNFGTRSGGDPRLQLSKRQPFADGGAIFVSRRAYAACPLNKQLGWGDAEDVEWCNRALSMGLLVDYWPTVEGITTIDKLSTVMGLPEPIFRAAQAVKRRATELRRLAKHLTERALRKR